MSKKNKKNCKVDYFNLTPEEQMANADFFNELEEGNVSLLDSLGYDVPTSPRHHQSSIARQIEESLFGILSEDGDTIDKSVTTVTVEEQHPNNDGINELMNKYPRLNAADVVVDTEVSTTSKLDTIQFNYDSITGRMFIDDGLIKTPISVCHATSIELDPEMIPEGDDALGEMMSEFFYYIITTKHPSVIMSKDTFEIEMSVFSKINGRKFIFFEYDGNIFAYIMNENEIENFYSVSTIFNLTDTNLLRYVVGSALVATDVHNAFNYRDEDEVETISEVKHDIKGLLEEIQNDPSTEYVGHNVGKDIMRRMQVIDLEAFASQVRADIDNLLMEDDLDDEEEDDVDPFDILKGMNAEDYINQKNMENIEDDDDDTEEVIDDETTEDFPELGESFTRTDDIDAMMESIESTDELLERISPETTTTIKVESEIHKVTPSKNANMTVPVVHRRR